jgi:hypothetical protein
MTKYCSRGALFFVFFTVAAVMISTIQGTEGALAEDGEASDLARAKRMDTQRHGFQRKLTLPLGMRLSGEGSSRNDSSKQMDDTNDGGRTKIKGIITAIG